jgi:hypothetical protein
MVMKRKAAVAVALISAVLFLVGSLTVSSPFASQAGLYLLDRDVGLGLLLVVLVLVGWTRPLGVVLLATAAMHVVDGIGDLALQNLPAALGSLVVAAASAVAALWLLTESKTAPSINKKGSTS